MKRIEKILISGFLLAVVFSFFGFSANCEGISNKVLRLHVLANSNSEYDQRIKLAVKDVVSQYAESLLSGAENLDESTEIINNNLQNIEHIANQKLKELHVHYEAKAIMKNAYFGTREYKDFSLPAGEYQALRILLGEASGKNWWCVVYP
ncbi:MAG: stage II sporulation protein R, partial [Oscillospiraceae bacterium]